MTRTEEIEQFLEESPKVISVVRQHGDSLTLYFGDWGITLLDDGRWYWKDDGGG